MAEPEPEIFEIYARGIAHCSVCTTLTDGEATVQINRESPTGISTRWAIVERRFASGEPNPCPCDRWPMTHRHILFSC